jgi:CheY-like chemotaxis protein
MNGHILVIDDNDDLRETVQMLLESSGYSVATAANGRAALAHLQGGSRPSLILLDLMMPDMNGWQFLDHARGDQSLSSIPILIMTAHQPSDVARLPPAEVVPKPFDAATLLAAIARHVSPT